MRILFVVQRYGTEVAGGAELHCRYFATRLAARGHDVHTLTTCATSYVDWANELPAGESELDGVTLHRMPVDRPRDNSVFEALNARVVTSISVPWYLQRSWMEMQGPRSSELAAWLSDRAAGFDVVVFFTYLYWTTWAGTEAVLGKAPAVLHPTAHDEAAFYLPVFDDMWWRPTGYAFSTEEERALLRRRTHADAVHGGLHEIVGVGTDLDVSGDAERFRAAYGLGDRPYLLYVGRLDPGKGADELHGYFTAFKERHPGPLALVVLGDPVKELPEHADVVLTGFVDDQTRDDAFAGATALVQPSYFESFSMVLAEAWAFRLPVLVQGHCEVLVGQTMRSGGGIPYWGFPEFEASLELLLERPELQRELGERGRRYVEERYEWEAVMDRYEALLGRVAEAGVTPALTRA